jgi:hypothetical protein
MPFQELRHRSRGSLHELIVCLNAERGDFSARVIKMAASLALTIDVRDSSVL